MQYVIKQIPNHMWISTYFNFNKIYFNSQFKSKRHDCTLHSLHLSRILVKSYATFTISTLKLGMCVCWWKKAAFPIHFDETPCGAAAVDWTWDRLNFLVHPLTQYPTPTLQHDPAGFGRWIIPPLLPPSGQSWGHLLQTARNLVHKFF